MVRGIKTIALYDEGTAEALDIGEITQYLVRKMKKVKVEARRNPFTLNLSHDRIPEYAKKIASTKIQGVSERMQAGQEPLYGEIEYEKRRIQGSTSAFGVLYDGLASKVGTDFLEHEIEVWDKMIIAIDQGQLRPTHLRGRKPGRE